MAEELLGDGGAPGDVVSRARTRARLCSNQNGLLAQAVTEPTLA
jgi:hypothetical protein